MSPVEVREWMWERDLTNVSLAKGMGISVRGVDRFRRYGTRHIIDIALNCVYPMPRRTDHQQ
jgi:hypothetical protein